LVANGLREGLDKLEQALGLPRRHGSRTGLARLHGVVEELPDERRDARPLDDSASLQTGPKRGF
jgi:hypothetical protein